LSTTLEVKSSGTPVGAGGIAGSRVAPGVGGTETDEVGEEPGATEPGAAEPVAGVSGVEPLQAMRVNAITKASAKARYFFISFPLFKINNCLYYPNAIATQILFNSVFTIKSLLVIINAVCV
jgi:hypothetical protein